jgi:hypothetical protein
MPLDEAIALSIDKIGELLTDMPQRERERERESVCVCGVRRSMWR